MTDLRLDLARRTRLVVLLLAIAASPLRPPAIEAPVRDPDRGLDEALRARLALVDPARHTSSVELWAALVEARLDLVARLWSEDRIAALAEEGWIAKGLAVPPLVADPSAATLARDPWRIVTDDGRSSRAPQAEQPLVPALAAWRASFPGEARLEHEVFSVEGHETFVETRIRLTASGPGPAAHLQHDVVWRCTWKRTESGAGLTALRPESFQDVTLARHPRGLFSDVTESVVGETHFRAQIAPGLDQWRRTIPAAVEPGSLGHHGLAVGDADGDGLDDLYWCRPGGLPNKLLLHAPDDTVVDASASAGVDLLDYSSSALLVDLDRDDDADLVVATGSGLVFFANDGRAHFEQRLHRARSLPTSLAAADFDGDGDLDLYVCSYVSPYEQSGMPVPYHAAENGEENALLRNDGEWRFVDATVDAGLGVNNRRFSLAASWEDFDDDGDPDLYVANDFGRNNLYRNEGGHFTDVAAELGVLDVAAGMGVTWGDVDDDGWPDLYVTNLYSSAGNRLTAQLDSRAGHDASNTPFYRHHALGNSLFLGQEGRAFRDVSAASGTARGRWGWGALFVDLDGDGALDLFAPNGFVTGERGEDLDSFFWRQVVLQSPDAGGDPGSYGIGWRAARRLVRQGASWNGHERNAAFLNLGGARFADVSSATGLDLPDDSRAAARVDWDGDGDEDLLVANRTGPMLRLLRNESDVGPRWIAFELRGQQRTAVGARVQLETTGGRHLVRSLRCGEGYLAQSSARLHFGLGTEGVRRLVVRWPGGAAEEFGRPSAGATYRLEQGSGHAVALSARTTPSSLRPSQPAPTLAAESARTVLATPLPLPRLALETWDGRPASLLGITMQGPRGIGQPLLLVAWAASMSSARGELQRLAAGAETLRAAGIQVLALDLDTNEGRAGARTILDELAWPFGRAFAGEEALQILELVQAALHDDAHGLALPTGFLVDPAGRLSATYQGRLEPERVRQDLGLFEHTPEERRNACVPFAGRWIAPPPDGATLEADVAARLDAHGLARPAGEYRLARVEVRTLSAAASEYELGVASHRAGRMAETIAHYRRALRSIRATARRRRTWRSRCTRSASSRLRSRPTSRP